MIPSLDDLRDRVARLRTDLGLSQAAAAQEADVSQSFVAKLENGGSVPNYRDAARLHNALEALQDADQTTAADLMTPDIIGAEPDDRVADAADRMKREGFSQLPVVDGETCVGSITSRGLLGAAPNDPVRDHMRSALPTVPAATPRDAVRELLDTENAVIVTEAGRLAGIITAADLL